MLSDRKPYRLGAWEIDPVTRELRRGGEVRRLEPKTMEVLSHLVRRAGQPVARAELEGAVWPGAVIGADTLNRAISKLRRALSEGTEPSLLIETIPKVGYRIPAAAVERIESVVVVAGASRYWGRIGMVGLVVVVAVGSALLIGRARAVAGPDGPLTVLPFTSDPGYESTPSVSPDGRYVAFQRYDKTRPGRRTWDVYVRAVDADGLGIPLAATDAQELNPAWAPAGDSVAFVRRTPDSCEVVLAPALGGAATRLWSCEPGTSPHFDWLPDGQGLLVATGRGGLRRFDRATRRWTGLTEPPAGFAGDVLPHVSPDGATVAFVRNRMRGIGDLYLVSIGERTPARRLTRDHRRIDGLVWAPNGTQLLFTSNRGGNSHLWRLDLDGGRSPVRVAMTGRNASRVSMAAASGLLLYEEYYGDSNVWEIPAGDAPPRAWSQGTRSEWSPRISPDGARVAFVSDRSGSAEVWVADRDGQRPVRLTDLQGGMLDPPRWSPDGTRLVYAAALAGDYDVYAVAATGGDALPIAIGPGDDRAPSWSASGEDILFASDRTGAWHLHTYAVATGATRRVTSASALGSAVAADGTIFVTRPDRAGLWRVDANGVGMTLVWDAIDPGDWSNFTVWNGEVYYLRVANTDAPRLQAFHLTTRRVRDIATPDAEAPDHAGVSVAPDGSVLIALVDRSESDLWMTRNAHR